APTCGGCPLSTAAWRRDASAFEVPKNGPAGLPARAPSEVLLRDRRRLGVGFVHPLRGWLPVAVLSDRGGGPAVPVGGLTGGPVAAADVLLLALDALGPGHSGMELVPDLHHLLDRLVHVRTGLGQVKEDELDPTLLAQVELEALGLERVPRDPG